MKRRHPSRDDLDLHRGRGPKSEKKYVGRDDDDSALTESQRLDEGFEAMREDDIEDEDYRPSRDYGAEARWPTGALGLTERPCGKGRGLPEPEEPPEKDVIL